MNKTLIFVVIAIGLCQSVSSAPQTAAKAEKKCPNESVRETCLSSLFIIASPDKTFPNTTERLVEFCGKIKETDKCIKDYTTRCMDPMGRRATQVAVAGISRLLKRMCRSSERRKEFVKNAGCGNAMIGDMRSCLNDYKMALYGAEKAEVKQRMPILCCKFHDFRGCVRKGFDKVGETVCPDSSRQYFAHIADAFQSLHKLN
ncbi:unnamed protein product [Medioppia subpectinata]|uniref:Uncharacterized protein n=1 Tax=Medioppia subpectinata TaxID=1979941 RepID=A0A7R9PYT0_9ACAR|nr:unnamed protein product [Medioppia subpectinata]CAG2106373.1 unnamed protein product [Medioppia subpectinata]